MVHWKTLSINKGSNGGLEEHTRHKTFRKQIVKWQTKIVRKEKLTKSI